MSKSSKPISVANHGSTKTRGRPVSGVAKSAANRKRDSRENTTHTPAKEFSGMSKTALLHLLSHPHASHDIDLHRKKGALIALGERFGFMVTIKPKP